MHQVAMEALWGIEEKWKLTTEEALLLFVCTSFAVVGLCTATALKMKKAKTKQTVDQHADRSGPERRKWSEPGCRRVLAGSLRWSGAKRWEEGSLAGWRGRQSPLLGLGRYKDSVGWRSRHSASPVWQRPILMGEKCELPRFSGLILYDEKGRLLGHSLKEARHRDNTQQVTICLQQEKPTVAARTTLKDLL